MIFSTIRGGLLNDNITKVLYYCHKCGSKLYQNLGNYRICHRCNHIYCFTCYLFHQQHQECVDMSKSSKFSFWLENESGSIYVEDEGESVLIKIVNKDDQFKAMFKSTFATFRIVKEEYPALINKMLEMLSQEDE